MEKLEERILNLIKQLEEEKRLADKRAKQLYGLGGAADKISEGDSKVEVVDLGAGYITTLADNQEVRRDKVLGNIQPLQPAFLVTHSQSELNVTGDGTTYDVPFNTEIIDQGGNFAANVFTAPVDGQYIFAIAIMTDDTEGTTGFVQLLTSNIDYPGTLLNPGAVKDSGNKVQWLFSAVAEMDANDTAYVRLKLTGGAKVVDYFAANRGRGFFSGALLS